MELPQSLLDRTIGRGSILLSDVDFVDHKKFFVVMGETDDKIMGCFFINSNIHRAIQNKPEQFAMQYPVKRADYPFLSYDSFLNCSNILEFDKQEVINKLQDGRAVKKGEMQSSHIGDILEMCRNSKVFSKHEKDAYFYE